MHVKTIAIVALFASLAHAASSGVTYQGRILKPDGTPLNGTHTQFKMQIRTPDAQDCLMYEEVQQQNLSQTDGAFSLTINDGTGTRTDSTGLTLDQVFANHGAATFATSTCSSGTGTYTPNPSDGRNLVVYFRDETMSTWEPIPAQKLNFVPFAFEAKQVAGFTINNLVRVAESDGTLDSVSPLNNAQYNALAALASGASSAAANGQVLGWNGSSWVPAQVGTQQLAGDVTIDTTGTVGSAVTTTRDFKIYAASPSTFGIDMRAPALTASYSLVWPSTAGSSGQVLTTDGAGNLSWSTQWATHGSNISYDGGGSVGIGNSNPWGLLDVHGSDSSTTEWIANESSTAARTPGLVIANFDGSGFGGFPQLNFRNSRSTPTGGAAQQTQAGDTIGQITFSGNRGGVYVATANIQTKAAEAYTSSAQGTSLIFSTAKTGTAGAAERMRIDASGNVGIGTTSPQAALDVNGALQSTALTVSRADAYTSAIIQNTSSAINRYPAVAVQNWAGSSSGYPMFNLQNSRGTSVTSSPLNSGDTLGLFQAVGVYNAANTVYVGANIRFTAAENFTATSAGSNTTFSTTNLGATTPTEKMRISANGNVGIGTTSPGAMLDVAGQFRTSGTTPTVGACGTGAAVSGTDQAGRVSVGTGTVTSCQVNFHAALTSAPASCVLFPANAAAAQTATTGAYVSAVTASSWTLSGSNLTGAAFYFHCY